MNRNFVEKWFRWFPVVFWWSRKSPFHLVILFISWYETSIIIIIVFHLSLCRYRYLTPNEMQVRFGRLLEDLDTFAVACCYKHNECPDLPVSWSDLHLASTSLTDLPRLASTSLTDLPRLASTSLADLAHESL